MNWYYCPGAGKIKGHRLTLVERFKLWQGKRKRAKEMRFYW